MTSRRLAHSLFAAIAAGFMATATAAAQSAATTTTPAPPPPSPFSMGPIVPFLEATDVFWSSPDFKNDRKVDGVRDFYQPPFKLEANIFPHLIFRQTYTDVIEVESQDDRADDDEKEFSYSISGTPGVRLRMLTSESSPVRTPSFTPRVNLQGLWARGLKEKFRQARAAAKEDAAREPTAKPSAVRGVDGRELPGLVAANRGSVGLYEAHVRIAHYSNGQEGCLSMNQARDEDDDQSDCVPETVPLDGDTINRKNGSFSTNFVAVGVNYMRNNLRTVPGPPTEARNWLAHRELRAGLELEWHFKNDRIKDYYSSKRVNATAGAAWRDAWICDRRLDLAANATVGLDRKDDVTNNSWSAQATCMPLNRGGWGFFVRYVGGQDYYNVQLFETIHRVQVGFTFNQGGFFGFRSRPPEATGTAP